MEVKSAENIFMARAIELSIQNVRSGRGGPFAAVVVKDGKVIAEGVNQGNLLERSHGARRSGRHSGSLQEARALRAERLRALYLLRTMSDVSRCDLLGAPGASLFWQYRGGRF